MVTSVIFKLRRKKVHVHPNMSCLACHSSSHFPTIEIMMLDEWKNALINREARNNNKKTVAIEDSYRRLFVRVVRCMSNHLEKCANWPSSTSIHRPTDMEMNISVTRWWNAYWKVQQWQHIAQSTLISSWKSLHLSLTAHQTNGKSLKKSFLT